MAATAPLELIDAVIYGDVFDCAVTLEEVHNFSRRKIGVDPLRDELDELVTHSVIAHSGGLYHLPGREELARERPERIHRARRLRRRALRVARWLRHAPFVRGIYLTGSVAADHAEPDADVDLLIVIAPGRLGLAFAQFGPLARIVSRQVFCPNYYICSNHLELSRRIHYVARELAQTRPLVSEGNPLIDENDWVREHLPNFRAHDGAEAARPGSVLQRLLELPLRGSLGQRLEERARRLVVRRLHKHYEDRGWQLPEEVLQQFACGEALRFHASDRVDGVAAELEMRVKGVAARLERASEAVSAEAD